MPRVTEGQRSYASRTPRWSAETVLRGGFALALILVIGPVQASAIDETPGSDDRPDLGRAIYVRQCAECHGDTGDDFLDETGELFYGAKTRDELTRYIDREMPDGEPELCVGEEAEAVADYLYRTIYDPAARESFALPEADLTRLTVDQYLNSVADLVASFGRQPRFGDEEGLEGSYHKSRRHSRRDRVFERTDPRVAFEFKQGTPVGETEEQTAAFEDPEQFAISWSGSILIEETGDYEFVVRSENGVWLYLNDNETPLIDAKVASSEEVQDHRATVRLLGGRSYPLKLNFFKFKDKSASVELRWVPPGRVEEVIPARVLRTAWTPTSLVITTPFPPDDRSLGYERGSAVSKAWFEATTYAAIEAANAVLRDLDDLAGIKRGADNRVAKLRTFCQRFVERAFRRPVDPETMTRLVDVPFATCSEPEEAVKRVVLLTLTSPRFLYPELIVDQGENLPHADDYRVANRLALAFWDSLPGESLLDAARQGRLHTAEQIERHSWSMLEDPRAKAKLRRFFNHWLNLDEVAEISKDQELFPEFDQALVADLKTSMDLFLDDIFWSDLSDYQQLLLSDAFYVNRRLAEFYDVPLPEPENEDQSPGTFVRAEVDPALRSGVVTHPLLLSAFAYHDAGSPIHRGVFATRRLLNRVLNPPPENIEFEDARFDPTLTMREKVTEITSPANCMACHKVINPLGFALENFDAVGRFREIDNGKPVDTRSEFALESGETMTLDGPRDLAQLASQSDSAHRGFVTQLFHHLVHQPVLAHGRTALDDLTSEFVGSEFHMRKLVVAIARTAAIRGLDATRHVADIAE